MTTVLFYTFALVAIGAAVLSITRKNAVAAACWLVLMFFGLAGTYVLLEAYFVAAVQILVYAGAIMVLFLFVIMLLDLRNEDLAVMGAPQFKALGIAAAVGFLAVAGFLAYRCADAFTLHSEGGPDGGPGAIGEVLFNRWLLAFEVTSFLLLAGMLGAVILTKRRLS